MEHGFSRAKSESEPFSGSGTGHTQERLLQALRFPGDDGGKSLTEMAKLDLQATLQLLAERAQYITGATGAAIALWEEELMVCRASVGSSAPEIGSHLQINSGLSAESVRLRQVLRCDNTESDPRVNRESCRKLGIASVLIMPLIGEDEVIGVFELFSDKPAAFAERDSAALERMGEMIHTALAHAQAARQVDRAQTIPPAIADKPSAHENSRSVSEETVEEDSILAVEESKPSTGGKGVIIPIRHKVAEPELPPPILVGELGRIGKCEACGFPISPGRVLCVDCEMGRSRGAVALQPDAQVIDRAINQVPAEQREPDVSGNEAPRFLTYYGETANGESNWFASRRLWMVTALLVAIVALLFLLERFGVIRLPS